MATSNRRNVLVAALFAASLLSACDGCTSRPPRRDAGDTPFQDGNFVCFTEDQRVCVGNTHYSCTRDGEFLSRVVDDCSIREDGHNVCDVDRGCTLCRPNEMYCEGNDVVQCNAEGDGFTVIEACDLSMGFACRDATCQNLCEIAVRERSYQGCEFYAADLDNASLGLGEDASAQQFSVVVSNPSNQPTEVVVEQNNAAPGEPLDIEIIETVTLLPGDLEILNLARREVDGSSSFIPCEATSECMAGDSCWCTGPALVEDPPPSGGMHRGCRCRVGPNADGMDDGPGSALTSRGYRVRSVLPIIAYQFNPLDNVGVFSNDASLLLPTSAIGREYSVVGWPQTLAVSINPNENGMTNLRAFLTVMGTADNTEVEVTFGPQVRRVLPVGEIADGVAGDVWRFTLNQFDVLNLETEAFNGDFTGSTVTATAPVGVFVGSEASDAPRFDSLATRSCCADHLEEQLFPRDTLGQHFFIGRMPARTVALNAAFLDPTVDSVPEFDCSTPSRCEPEFVRIMAVEDGVTVVETTLPPPRDRFELVGDGILCPSGNGTGCRSTIITADQDFEMTSDHKIAVVQVISSQGAVGIRLDYPGGDPAMIVVPPVEQYRREYVFLTPSLYGFDFVTIEAPRLADVQLDEMSIRTWVDNEMCTVSASDGIPRRMDDPPPEWVVYRCQFSFPEVIGTPSVRVEDGEQRDGYHTVRASEEVGIVIYGFDRYVSYAYAGGLNLDIIQ